MNVELLDLWLPIVLSAVICFVASAIIWMALPYHKSDIKPLPDEAGYIAAVRGLSVPPGLYMYPNCHGGEDMKSEAFKAKWKHGPWGVVNVIGAQPNFGKNLLITFLEMLGIAIIVAYLATMGVAAGAEYMQVFRFIGAGAILGFVFGPFAHDAFLAKPARFQITCALDGIVFALLMAGTFAWLWPESAGSTGPGAIPTP